MEAVKAVLKSLGAGLVGMGLFFSFFAMLSVPVLTVIARLHDPNAPLEAPDVLLQHANFVYRYIGLPLSAVAFVLVFVLTMKRCREREQHP
jgi:uncharacterized membrane protein